MGIAMSETPNEKQTKRTPQASTDLYLAWLDRLYDTHENNSKKAVLEAHKLLKAQGKDAKEIRTTIEHDLGKIWKIDTIQRHYPDDLRDPEMQAVRAHRTEKQTAEKERRKQSYATLEDLLKIPITTDGSNAPVIPPDVAKKLLDAFKLKDDEVEKLRRELTSKKPVQAGRLGSKSPSKGELAQGTEITNLKLTIEDLKSKLLPYTVDKKFELWGKTYRFIVTVDPLKRTAVLSQPKKDHKKQ